jgi:hypothetical protein
MFLIFSNHFDVLISKIIFFKKNIILMCFGMKSTLKINHYYTLKHSKKKKERESLAGFWRKKSARQFLIVLMFYILQMQKRHAWFLLMDHVLTFLKKWEFGIYLVGKD